MSSSGKPRRKRNAPSGDSKDEKFGLRPHPAPGARSRDDGASDDKSSETSGGVTQVASRVPLSEIRAGHLLSKTEYMRVLEAKPAENKLRCEVLRGDKPNDIWEITTPDALLACSTEYVQREVKLNKTELADRLVACKDDVFKVVFRPVLNAESSFVRMKELRNEIIEADTDAKLRKVAKKYIEVPEKTLKARLLLANTVLGYSLVDDLEQQDAQKVAFRNVTHNNILSITVGGVRYVLK